jgi:hypothetical protein
MPGHVVPLLPSLRTTSMPAAAEGRSRRSWLVADGWQQGRGAWGGLVTAAMLDAVLAEVDDPALRVRHLSAQLLAPVPPGPTVLELEVLRRGSATLTVDVRIVGAEAGADAEAGSTVSVLACASVVLGTVRAPSAGIGGESWRVAAAPRECAAGWRDVAVVEVPVPPAPRFTGQLEMRPLTGYPASGAFDGLALGWVRPAVPELLPQEGRARTLDVLLTALADLWWPSTLVRLPQLHPMATVGFALDLPTDASVVAALDDGDGMLAPVLHRGRLVAGRDGYTTETRELWSASGELLAWNTQTVAVIR